MPASRADFERQRLAERDQAIRADYEAGKTTPEIAAERGMHLQTVINAVRRAGGTLRGKGRRPGHDYGDKLRRFTKEDRERMASLYLEGKSLDEVAEAIGCSQETVREALMQLGVERRPDATSRDWKIRDGLDNNRRMFERRRERGECPYCGCPNKTGKRTCEDCHGKGKRKYQGRKKAGLCPMCGKQPPLDGFVYCASCREDINRRGRNFYMRLRVETFEAYGGCWCACCGEKEMIFLALDHINNDGAQHRRMLRAQGLSPQHAAGISLYRRLRKEGFPPGFQVLCHNCNFAKSHGGCPHQRGRGSHPAG